MSNKLPTKPGILIIIQDSKLARHNLSQQVEAHGLPVFTLDKIQNITLLLSSFTPYCVVCRHKNSILAELTELFGEPLFKKQYKSFDEVELEKTNNQINLVLVNSKDGSTLLFTCNGLNLKQPKLELHTQSRSISYASQRISFTHAEFIIIKELINNQGSVVDKAYLSQLALRRSAHPDDRSIDVHICRIRKKLTPLLGKDAVKSVRCMGYSFSSKAQIILD